MKENKNTATVLVILFSYLSGYLPLSDFFLSIIETLQRW
jgi:hypothetical protein